MGSLKPFIDAHFLHYSLEYKKFLVNMYIVHVDDPTMFLF